MGSEDPLVKFLNETSGHAALTIVTSYESKHVKRSKERPEHFWNHVAVIECSLNTCDGNMRFHVNSARA